MEHYSVLLKESVEMLNIREDGIYVDGTLGRGGHSEAILKQLKNGKLYAFDKDETAIEESKKRLENYENCIFIQSDFRNMSEELHKRGVEKVDGIVLDLGVSSPQFDDPERGFSYRYDAPLDMRMDQKQPLSAYEVINSYDEKDLIRILREYGEEKYASSITRSILAHRPIRTTSELVEAVRAGMPYKALKKEKHPAKQTFQAVRIEVNDELQALKDVLAQALQLLDENGRLAVITFHSLEDRIVKQAFNSAVNVDTADRRIPLLPDEIPISEYELINKKPITADEKELEENRRSHSAKLRGIRRKQSWQSEREKSEN